MKSTIFSELENTENEGEVFVLQNPHMLLINLQGKLMAKQGSMVAYQGNIDFKYHGGGAARMLKKMVTTENLELMECTGQGDIFLANMADHIHIIDLEQDSITVSASNILAFQEGISWDINRLKGGVMAMAAGGLFNTTLSGTGKIAISTQGRPVVLNVDAPTFVDVNAVVAWSPSLQVNVKSSFKAGALVGRGSGESFQMAFSGGGYVIVQPSEYVPYVPK